MGTRQSLPTLFGTLTFFSLQLDAFNRKVKEGVKQPVVSLTSQTDEGQTNSALFLFFFFLNVCHQTRWFPSFVPTDLLMKL